MKSKTALLATPIEVFNRHMFTNVFCPELGLSFSAGKTFLDQLSQERATVAIKPHTRFGSADFKKTISNPE